MRLITIKLSLDKVTIQHLKDYRKHLTIIPNIDGLVFVNHNGKMLSTMTPNHWLNTLLKITKLPYITVHGFRHTFASIQVANNINPKALQLQLGHGDISVTLDTYTHFTQEELTAQVYSISKVISNQN